MKYMCLPITSQQLPALDSASFIANDREAYRLYKLGLADNLSKVEMTELKTLELLEKLGCNMNMAGTYMLKEMVMTIIRHLEGVPVRGEVLTFQELMEEIENPFSQFYFDIARNDLDIGIKTFHAAIQLMILSLQDEVISQEDIMAIFGEKLDIRNYPEVALKIAQYLEAEKLHMEDGVKLERIAKDC